MGCSARCNTLAPAAVCRWRTRRQYREGWAAKTTHAGPCNKQYTPRVTVRAATTEQAKACCCGRLRPRASIMHRLITLRLPPLPSIPPWKTQQSRRRHRWTFRRQTHSGRSCGGTQRAHTQRTSELSMRVPALSAQHVYGPAASLLPQRLLDGVAVTPRVQLHRQVRALDGVECVLGFGAVWAV